MVFKQNKFNIMFKKILFAFLILVCFQLKTVVNAQSVNVTFKQNSNTLKEIVLTNAIKMDPNVVHDYVKISLDPALKDLHKTIAIYDILGRLVTIELFEGTEKQLFLQNLSHGLYFVKIDSPEVSIVSKFQID